jgi:hypothetical protein
LKPRLQASPLTLEDCEVLVWQAGARRKIGDVFRLRHFYEAADRRDALIMLGRGIHIAMATHGRIPYWRPEHYWVAADGSVGFEIAMAYTRNL